MRQNTTCFETHGYSDARTCKPMARFLWLHMRILAGFFFKVMLSYPTNFHSLCFIFFICWLTLLQQSTMCSINKTKKRKKTVLVGFYTKAVHVNKAFGSVLPLFQVDLAANFLIQDTSSPVNWLARPETSLIRRPRCRILHGEVPRKNYRE